MNNKKLLKKILSGTKNIKFNDFVQLVIAFGFGLERINGSHHIFKKEGVAELINLQNVNNEVKPYQVKQFLFIVEKYDLKLGEKS